MDAMGIHRLMMNSLYNYRFSDAAGIYQDNGMENTGDAILCFSVANYYWWLIISGEETDENIRLAVASLDRGLEILKKREENKLSNQEIYLLIVHYAYKVRLDLFRKKYFSAVNHLGNCISYLKTSFSHEKEYPAFMLTSGLYYYAIESARESYPLISPFFAIYPKGDKSRGLQYLKECAGLDDHEISAEANYFLLKIYLESEKKYDQAEIYARKLLELFPDNLVFRYLLCTSLLQQGKFDQAEIEILQLRQLGEKNSQLTTEQKRHFLKIIKNEIENR